MDNHQHVIPILMSSAALALLGYARYQQMQLEQQGALLEGAEGNQENTLQYQKTQAFKALSTETIFEQALYQLIQEHPYAIHVPSEYLDPYTHHIMIDPITLSDNQTYNKHTADYIVKYEKISPITQEEIFDCVFDQNHQLKNEIEGWIKALNEQYNDELQSLMKALSLQDKYDREIAGDHPNNNAKKKKY